MNILSVPRIAEIDMNHCDLKQLLGSRQNVRDKCGLVVITPLMNSCEQAEVHLMNLSHAIRQARIFHVPADPIVFVIKGIPARPAPHLRMWSFLGIALL